MLFNRGEAPRVMAVDWAAIGLEVSSVMAVRDVVKKEDRGSAAGSWNTTVAPHAVAFVVLAPAR